MGALQSKYAAPPVDSLLDALLDSAGANSQLPGAYAGEVTPMQAWDYLSEVGDALMVDVRTEPEWQFVGTPEMSDAKGRLVTISWKTYPDFKLNPAFAEQVKAQSITPETPIFFLCRSGGRSLDAAIAMTQQGFRYCFNVTGGFEGDPDTQRHRGSKSGWKAAGLPWGQP